MRQILLALVSPEPLHPFFWKTLGLILTPTQNTDTYLEPTVSIFRETLSVFSNEHQFQVALCTWSFIYRTLKLELTQSKAELNRKSMVKDVDWSPEQIWIRCRGPISWRKTMCLLVLSLLACRSRGQVLVTCPSPKQSKWSSAKFCSSVKHVLWNTRRLRLC